MAGILNTPCTLIDRFSLPERILVRLGWYGFMAVGTYGIYRQSPLWAVLYLAYSAAGFLWIVLPGLCAHCPYPSRFGTCLFLPPRLLNRFYPYKGPHMRPAAKLSVLMAMAGMLVIPNIWLVSDPPRLLLFWGLGLPVLAVFPLHYCRRCRHSGCFLNRAAGSKRSSG